jgi:hypothetical protein
MGTSSPHAPERISYLRGSRETQERCRYLDRSGTERIPALFRAPDGIIAGEFPPCEYPVPTWYAHAADPSRPAGPSHRRDLDSRRSRAAIMSQPAQPAPAQPEPTTLGPISLLIEESGTARPRFIEVSSTSFTIGNAEASDISVRSNSRVRIRVVRTRSGFVAENLAGTKPGQPAPTVPLRQGTKLTTGGLTIQFFPMPLSPRTAKAEWIERAAAATRERFPPARAGVDEHPKPGEMRALSFDPRIARGTAATRSSQSNLARRGNAQPPATTIDLGTIEEARTLLADLDRLARELERAPWTRSAPRHSR